MKINLKGIGKFLKARLKEKSTYIGAAALAVALGKPEIGAAINEYSNIGLLIIGGGLMASGDTGEAPADTV